MRPVPPVRHTRPRTAAVVGAAACLGAVGLVFAAGVGAMNDVPERDSAPSATLLDPEERAALPEPIANNRELSPGAGFAPIEDDAPLAPDEGSEGQEEPLAQAVAGEEEPAAAPALEPDSSAADAAPAPVEAPPTDPTDAQAVADGGAAASAELSTDGQPDESAASDPADPADPAAAQGQRCGATTCAEGLVCCNETCGTCVRPGETCSQYSCAARPHPSSQFCGPTTCNVNEVCCNPSCGTCVAPGETCDLTACARDIQTPVSYMCGMTTCNVGMVCCNPSCGICTPPDGTCSQEACD